MAVTNETRAQENAASGVLRHVPSLLVLAGIVTLFAAVGSGLPGRPVAPEEVAQAEAAAKGLERTEDGLLIPKAESDPTALAELSPTDALFRNAQLPTDTGPNPAADPFRLTDDQVSRMRSIDCLAAAVYYESGLEPLDGQRAVAQVVLNRVRHPAYPNTVCGVVFQGHQRTTGCQFSFTCSGHLRRVPHPALFARARRVAEEALNGYVHRPVGWATHFHANYVFPNWAPTLTKVATIGAHIFYRWDQGGPLSVRYAGGEPDIRWRGGFGQVDRNELAAAAAAARAAAVGPGNPDLLGVWETGQVGPNAEGGTAFLRSVVRRYEPVNTEAILNERAQTVEQRPAAQAQAPSSSNRWSLTGRGSPASETQRPLGRPGAEAPRPLDGVRRRPASDTPEPPMPSDSTPK